MDEAARNGRMQHRDTVGETAAPRTAAASNAADADAPADCLVVCMCGLPGSGKTTVAGQLRDAAQSAGVDARVLSLDDLLLESGAAAAVDAVSSPASEFSPEAWQSARKALLYAAASAAAAPVLPPHEQQQHEQQQRRRRRLVVVDDVNHLAGMRRDVWRVARSAGAAFAQVFCDCPLVRQEKRRGGGTGQGERRETTACFCCCSCCRHRRRL